MSQDNWSFSAQIERFEGEGHMHFVAIPDALVDDIRSQDPSGTPSP